MAIQLKARRLHVFFPFPLPIDGDRSALLLQSRYYSLHDDLFRSFGSDFRSHYFIDLPPGNAALKKRVEDVMPIATGHEREELEADLEVRFFFLLRLRFFFKKKFMARR
jgi:hypothetical protein